MGRAHPARLRQLAHRVRAGRRRPGRRHRARAGHVGVRAGAPPRRVRVGPLGRARARPGGRRPPAAGRGHRCRRPGRLEPRRVRRGQGAGRARGRRGAGPGHRPHRLPRGRPRRRRALRGRRRHGAAPLRGRGAARPGRRRPDPARVDPLLRRGVPRGAPRPEQGMAAARESVDVAVTTGNPTALSMARYALGLVLKKSDPERALARFDEAAGLAASVRNFWWHGIALMEAAATRAVHADPASGARGVRRGARPLGPRRGLDATVAEPALRGAAARPARRRRGRRRAAPRPRRGRQAVAARRAGSSGPPPPSVRSGSTDSVRSASTNHGGSMR